MFVVIVCGGHDDGESISVSGQVEYGASPAYKFDTYADAQEFIESRQPAVNRGEFGVGASLGIDEIDGDICDEKF